MDFVPVSMPCLIGNETAYVNDAIQSSWISSTGAYLDRFEREFAEACGVSDALAVSNGTVALHLALLALGVGPGDEVIVPSLTYIATANAVTYVGATPIFADVDPMTWCLDAESVSQAMTTRTVGVIAVHLYGHPADMDAITTIAKRSGIWVIEDAAEAPFGEYKGRPVGSLADIATFSFYGNKVITSGEGGAVTTNDKVIARKMRLLRGQGMDPNRRYFFPVIGHNFRLTNVAAAILCAQMERRHELLAARRLICEQYRQRLHLSPGLIMQPLATWASWTPWLFSVLIDGPADRNGRDSLIQELARVGIDTRPFFIPIHTLPAYRAESRHRREYLPVTEELARKGLNLPTFPQMDTLTVDRVCTAIGVWLAKSGE